ncbi:NEDD4-binding protein 1 [Bactrocera neohumeralis]|uniref:NEDD4-binding protein 1 n=1 Tax=Bactrocera neohumeralis TaxID=98809 RepID=UPI00216528C2|nr:NEDD4-binding protein 1 [Bactrocera neohumeralis]
MRIGRKQKQKRIRRRGTKRNNNKSIGATVVTANDPNAPILTKQKRKRNRGKARKKFQRLSAKENLATQKLLTQRLNNGQSDSKDSGPSNSQIVSAMTQADETPTTSTKRKSGSFNKFRDNTKRRLQLRNKRLNRSTTSRDLTSASQRVTKKLLRTIRRRQLQNQNKSKLQRSLRTKLNMANKCAAPTSTLHNLSLEEGEIISDDEINNVNLTANTSTDNDDDCICVEPQIEQIIIDDDLPNTSRSKAKNNNSSGYVSIIQRINGRGTQDAGKLLTSTPCGGAASRNSSQKSVEDFTDLTTMFYEDVSRINTLDSIRSEDTFSNYTQQSRVVGNPKSNSRNRRRNKKKNHTVTSKDVIVLDDTVNDSTLRPASNAVNSKNQDVEMDDSVIFISETTRKSKSSSSALDFVPLSSEDVPNPIVVPVSPPRTPRRAAVNSGLFTTSEKKALLAYNNNTYNPNADDPKASAQQSQKRLILIDGCNVAFNHALNREFSVKGLKICIDYFEKMGHEVKAVVPQFRMHKCSDSAAMFELHGLGKIVVTPCKNLPGKFTISYDDRFVLQLAAEMDAAIVSNDNYRDLINENAAFKKLIENRVIGFTWCNDLFMVAKDPYGKWGPSLQTILNRT